MLLRLCPFPWYKIQRHLESGSQPPFSSTRFMGLQGFGGKLLAIRSTMSLTWTLFIFLLQVLITFFNQVRHKSSTFQLLQDIAGKASSTFGRWLQPADTLQTWWFSSKKNCWLQVWLLFAPRHFAQPKLVLLCQSCRVPCFPFQSKIHSLPNPPISARHVYADPAAVIFQVRQLRKFFPNSPIHVMSCLPWQVCMLVGATNNLFETSRTNHPQLVQLLPTVCVIT